LQVKKEIRDNELKIEALSSVNRDLEGMKVELQEAYILEFKEYVII
jgi:hypothetical protein